MKVLMVEAEYENTIYWEQLYNNFTDADVDVYSPSEMDVDELNSNGYDAVLSELDLGGGLMGSDVLDDLEADKKAIYTVWRESEAHDRPEFIDNFEKYPVINKPGPLNLADLIEQEL
jgi:hypothetical protein